MCDCVRPVLSVVKETVEGQKSGQKVLCEEVY